MRTFLNKLWAGLLSFLAAPYRQAEDELNEKVMQWQHAGPGVGPNCRCTTVPITEVGVLPDCLRGTDFTHAELSAKGDSWLFRHRRPERSILVSINSYIMGSDDKALTLDQAAKIALLRDDGWRIDGGRSNWICGPVTLARDAILGAPEQTVESYDLSRVGVWLEAWRRRAALNRQRQDAIHRAEAACAAAPIKDQQMKDAHEQASPGAEVKLNVNVEIGDPKNVAEAVDRILKKSAQEIRDSLTAASEGIPAWRLFDHASEDAYREHLAKMTLLGLGFYRIDEADPTYDEYLVLNRDPAYGEAEKIMITIDPLGAMQYGAPADVSNVWRRALICWERRSEFREARSSMEALGFTFSHRKAPGQPGGLVSEVNDRDLYIFNRDGMTWAVDRVPNERAWVTLAKFVATERGQNGLSLTSRNYTANIRPADVDPLDLVANGFVLTCGSNSYTSTELFKGSGLTFLRMHRASSPSFRGGIEVRHDGLPGKPTIVVLPGNTKPLGTTRDQIAWINEVITLLGRFEDYRNDHHDHFLKRAMIGTFGPQPGSYTFAHRVTGKEVCLYAQSIGEAWHRLELELRSRED